MSGDRDRLPGEIRPPGAEVPGDEASGRGAPGGGAPADDSPDGEKPLPDDEGEPIGIFPTWGWVYGTVVAWAAFLVVLLYVLTVTLDYGPR